MDVAGGRRPGRGKVRIAAADATARGCKARLEGRGSRLDAHRTTAWDKPQGHQGAEGGGSSLRDSAPRWFDPRRQAEIQKGRGSLLPRPFATACARRAPRARSGDHRVRVDDVLLR